jgi:hypothetical protein
MSEMEWVYDNFGKFDEEELLDHLAKATTPDEEDEIKRQIDWLRKFRHPSLDQQPNRWALLDSKQLRQLRSVADQADRIAIDEELRTRSLYQREINRTMDQEEERRVAKELQIRS